MKSILKNPVFAVICVLSLIVVLGFPDVVFHPNTYLFTAEGDGYKNYFTPAWFTAYDNGTHFSGMLYPFGENIVYADAQPGLVWAIQLISMFFPGAGNYTIGILHISIFVSFILCGVFLFLIIREYVDQRWFAALAAISITLLSPQLVRLYGHYALCYTCFIPIVWYLHIQLLKQSIKWKPLVWLTAVIAFFSFLHLYYLLTAILFIGGCLVLDIIINGMRRKEFLMQILTLAIPFACVFIYMQLSDTIPDRPDVPFGFTIHKANIGSVFIPADGFISEFWYGTLHMPPPNTEGIAYVGIIAVLATVAGLCIFIYRAFTGKARVALHKNTLLVYLTVAFLILLFSMAIPFIWGLENVVEQIPFIRQFRSPGRFAWVFYYVINVGTFVLIYRLYKKIQIKNFLVSRIFVVCTLSISFYEGMHYYTGLSNWFANPPANNLLSRNAEYAQKFSDAGIPLSDFQCILFVPVFMQGSEKLYIDNTENSFADAMTIAFQTQLPLVDCMMSRTSISNTLQLTSLTSHPALAAEIPAGFNQKKILLITNNKNLSKGDTYLIEQSQFLFEENQLQFFALPISALRNRQQSFNNSISDWRQKMTYDSIRNFYSDYPLELWHKNDFENFNATNAFYSSGALQLKSGGVYIDEMDVSIKNIIWIEVSYWAELLPESTAYPSLTVEFIDENGNVLARHGVGAKESTDVSGDWVRASKNFELKPECKTLRFYLEDTGPVLMDNFLVRHTAGNAIYNGPGNNALYFNNYPITQ